MAKATLISERESEKDYQIPNGRIITLVLNEYENSISFKENGDEIGDEFRFIDENFDDENLGGTRYLLARMYSPISNSGLGRAAIEFFKDVTGAIIYARPNDGIVREDGSHLTEDAPGFVMKMIKEGLLIDTMEYENDDEF